MCGQNFDIEKQKKKETEEFENLHYSEFQSTDAHRCLIDEVLLVAAG